MGSMILFDVLQASAKRVVLEYNYRHIERTGREKAGRESQTARCRDQYGEDKEGEE